MTYRSQFRFLAVALALASTTGCYRRHNIGAPAAPRKVMPDVDTGGAPGAGLSRVVLDVAEGPAIVERLRGGSVTGVAGVNPFAGALQVATRVCVTPCVVDAAPGTQELRFTLVDDDTRTSTGFINIDDKPSVYRHSIGRHDNDGWRGFVGWPLVLLGTFVGIGAIASAAQGEVGATLGFGLPALALGGFGGWMIYGSTIVDQPGSGVQWHP
ncbi:MAG: hypothetical protein IPH44_28445 [Myxococcales bacterium]|jgi:hypothetical protein|nr:hypothetical protein [Myxococcales bacterium]MBK7191462.1 hypothetical protein [Myxococcales bacterium]MBP6846692.1 hypothetical protein [Kofleriaceae bacterium]